MENIIKWITTPKDNGRYIKVDQKLLDQFKPDGYTIEQQSEEFFIIERTKNSHIVTSCSIATAHAVIDIALQIEKKIPIDRSIVRKSLLEKATTLVGRMDVTYVTKPGDKVRRKRGSK